MKNKFKLFLFLSSLLFSETCIDNWIDNNPNFKHKYFLINAKVNQDTIKLFYDYSGRIRFELDNSIIISNSEQTSKYYTDSNELYIDNSDIVFNEKIISLININKFKKNLKLYSDNIYVFKNKLKFGNTRLYFNDYCEKLDSVVIEKNKYKIKIENISLDTLDINNIDNIFSFHFEKDKVKIYDFKNE